MLIQNPLYRTDAIELLSTFQYADINDVLERPPYSILVRSIKPENGGIITVTYLLM